MRHSNWLDLVEKNEDEIIKKGIEVYKDALNSPFLRFVLCLDQDGGLSVMQDVAGGNNLFTSVFQGDSIEILEFCF